MAGWRDADDDGKMHSMYLDIPCLEPSKELKQSNAPVTNDSIRESIENEMCILAMMIKYSHILRVLSDKQQQALLQLSVKLHAQRYIEAGFAYKGSGKIDPSDADSLTFLDSVVFSSEESPHWGCCLGLKKVQRKLYQRVNELRAWGPTESRYDKSLRDCSAETVHMVRRLVGNGNNKDARERLVCRRQPGGTHFGSGLTRGWGVYSEIRNMYFTGAISRPATPEVSEAEEISSDEEVPEEITPVIKQCSDIINSARQQHQYYHQ